MQTVTSTGVALDTEDPAAELCNRHLAYLNKQRKAGVRGIVAKATHPNGFTELVLVQDSKVVFSARRSEDMAVHLDILAKAEEFKRQ